MTTAVPGSRAAPTKLRKPPVPPFCTARGRQPQAGVRAASRARPPPAWRPGAGKLRALQPSRQQGAAREANQPGWWNTYSDVLPQWFRAYVDLEAVAAQIRTYEGQLVPGLLQTEAYMRALMQGTLRGRRPEEIERRVMLRLARQRLLTRNDGPRLWAVVDEAALRRPVGGIKVRRGQIERLIEATTLPRVSLQVLPFSAGAHVAMVGAFSILRLPTRRSPTWCTSSTSPTPPTWTSPRTSKRTPTSCRASGAWRTTRADRGAPHPAPAGAGLGSPVATGEPGCRARTHPGYHPGTPDRQPERGTDAEGRWHR